MADESVTFENEKIVSMRAAARPTGLVVTTEVVEDQYYIHFDGEAANSKVWSVFWTSMSMYIKFLLLSHGFKGAEITKKSEYHAVAYLGTLFEILTKEK